MVCQELPFRPYDPAFADRCLQAAKKSYAFLAAHPDLYVRDGNTVRLSIHDGDLLTGSLTSAGFASGAHPDWAVLKPLQAPTARILQEQTL